MGRLWSHFVGELQEPRTLSPKTVESLGEKFLRNAQSNLRRKSVEFHVCRQVKERRLVSCGPNLEPRQRNPRYENVAANRGAIASKLCR